MLEKYNEGVIALSACLGGVYAGCYWENKDKGEEAILEAFRSTTKRMISIFGDRWYGEIQWNNIKEQVGEWAYNKLTVSNLINTIYIPTAL